MTADQVQLMRQMAERVLQNHEAGRVYDPETVQWAQDIVRQIPKVAA